MNHLYLFTLEIVPLEVGKAYADLPSHLTLMSRFTSQESSEELARIVSPVFAAIESFDLTFVEIIELGPKKVTAHMVNSADESRLHEKLRLLLVENSASFQYPEFIGTGHRAHITKRQGVSLEQGSQLTCSAAYLIEVVDKQRVVRAKFVLKPANN